MLLLFGGIALAPGVAAAADDNALVQADEATLREGDIGTDGPALLDYFRKQTLSEAERGRLARTVRKLGDHSFRVREKATVDLLGAGRAAVPFLRKAINDSDPEIARRARSCLQSLETGTYIARSLAAARLLGVRRPDGAVEVILNYLPYADDEQVEEELVAALEKVAVVDGKIDAQLPAALRDKADLRRAAAARVVGRFGDTGQRAAVHPLLADGDARVRFWAAQGLIAGRDKQGVPALIGLLTDGPTNLAWRAEDLLYRIAGDHAPAVSLGANNAERRKCRDKWAAWWRDHQAGVDLARLDLENRLLGLTLFVAYDGYPGGRIWETGPDGKERWHIEHIQGCIDAQVLPGERLLVAEHGAQRVTERNFKGDILWEYHVRTSPVSCQRLPGGNTFIGTYSEVMEVTPDKKVLYTYPCARGSSFCAQKLRNGHIVYVTMNGALLVELDRDGKEVRTLNVGAAVGWATVEALPTGGFLVAQGNSCKVVEFDAAGRAVWECTAVPSPNAATRLPNGNTLVCSNNEHHVMEVNRAGRVVWQIKLKGRPFRVRRR
jgi:HEAT repeat protein